MKTISVFFLAFILILLGCSKDDDLLNEFDEDAQLKSAENGDGYTEQDYFFPLGEDEYILPVECDGNVIDVLTGDGVGIIVHVIIHYKNGEMQWGKWLVKGELTSESTGEKFEIHEANKGQFEEDGSYYLTFHTNAIGDQGTHYLFKGKLLWNTKLSDGEFIVDKAMCVPYGNDK